VLAGDQNARNHVRQSPGERHERASTLDERRVARVQTEGERIGEDLGLTERFLECETSCLDVGHVARSG
jgi:hypothetical protein